MTDVWCETGSKHSLFKKVKLTWLVSTTAFEFVPLKSVKSVLLEVSLGQVTNFTQIENPEGVHLSFTNVFTSENVHSNLKSQK